MKIFQSTKGHLTTLLFVLISTFTVKAAAEPLLLSNTQLDIVSAGYVNLHGNAQADAVGPIALADIQVDIAQVQTQAEDGVIYTVSSVFAKATALGEQVETSVSAGFETNENIVSLEVVHSTVSAITSVNSRSRFRRSDHGVTPSESESGNERHSRGRFQRRHYHQRGDRRGRNSVPVIYQNETVKLTLITSQYRH